MSQAPYNLLISPHDDDNTLFASFLCIREKPLVVIVTDSYIQPQRGEIGCEADIRARETKEACGILGVPVIRLGLRDDSVTEEDIIKKLRGFSGFRQVYSPALQGGNKHHDMVHRATKALFPYAKYYTTYTPTELYTEGDYEIRPSEDELNLKYKAMACYKSQIDLPATAPHFFAVVNKSEWLI